MTALPLLSLLLCLLCASASAVITRQSLDGSGWTLTNTNGSIHIPATVPGVVHLDLLASHLINDTYYRYNEALQQWIPYESTPHLTTPDHPPHRNETVIPSSSSAPHPQPLPPLPP